LSSAIPRSKSFGARSLEPTSTYAFAGAGFFAGGCCASAGASRLPPESPSSNASSSRFGFVGGDVA
jgi:hypothetical protein